MFSSLLRLSLLCLLYSCISVSRTTKAEVVTSATPTPTPSAIFSYGVGRLAADPLRPRVYATVPNDNTVVVIDTTTLTVSKTIPIGSSPVGLAVSADGKKLWVANSGSTNFAIGVIDLETLTTLPSLPAPGRPSDIVEGLNHRLYVTPAQQSGGIMQIDGATGTFQTSFGGFEVYAGGLLRISPDRRTLFFGNVGLSPSTLKKYDVSTPTPALIQTGGNTGSNGESLSVSHNGQLLVYPNGGGNGGGYTTYEIPTTNLTSINGSFNVGAYPTASTFSNDDTLLYHGTSSQSAVKVFDTKFFTLLGTFPLGNSPGSTGGYDSKDLAVDRSGRWLFVATSYYPSLGDLRVFDIGRIDPLPLPGLANIATRVQVGQGDNVMIGGFIVTGNQSKKVMVRAIGPSLSQSGISGALADPTLELHDANGTVIATNDDWQTTQLGGVITSDQVSEIQSSGLAPKQAAESAIIATLAPGAYTAVVTGKNNTAGVALIESYDLNPPADSQLGNISTRGFVQTGDNVMIGGTIVTGSVSANIGFRAIGPSLTAAGVANALQDPTLELYDGYGTLVNSNDNWRSSQEAEIQASGLAPTNDFESVILATLTPGGYTAIVRGKNNTLGVALVEAYRLNN
ncbi:MAG: hypothetical protein ACXWBS_03505 [Chthoniobacterales bacterium]